MLTQQAAIGPVDHHDREEHDGKQCASGGQVKDNEREQAKGRVDGCGQRHRHQNPSQNERLVPILNESHCNDDNDSGGGAGDERDQICHRPVPRLLAVTGGEGVEQQHRGADLRGEQAKVEGSL